MDVERRNPSEFAEILAGPESPLIVGGQAVNLWAEVYAESVPELEAFAPFVSKDADIFGTRATAEALAMRSGWSCKFIDQKDSIVVAILTKSIDTAKPLSVEVLGEVNGLADSDLGISQIIETESGVRYRIPSPLVLLRAKLYNLASLVLQRRPQDLYHAKMLLLIAPAYLRDLAVQQRACHVSRQIFDEAVQYGFMLAREGFAGNAARAHGLDLSVLEAFGSKEKPGENPTLPIK